MMDVEQLKLDPEDFGGIQTRILNREEMGQRYCARKHCSSQAHIQVMVPGEEGKLFRVFCGRHFIMMLIIEAAVMGDPSPIGEGRRMAERIGLPFKNIPDVDAPQLVNMERIICDRCGGGAMPETVGMFAGRRWVHTCMTEEEKAAERRAGQ